MIDWFGDSVIVEAYPDSAGEKHGKPGEIWKFRFIVVSAQLDVRVLRKQKPEHKYEPNILGQDVHPREVDRDPPSPSAKLSREFRIGMVFVVNQYGGEKPHNTRDASNEDTQLNRRNLFQFR